MSQPLPVFADPPVVEVVLSAQFEPLHRLQTPQIGMLWQQFRDAFPLTEDREPIPPMVERFGGAKSPLGSARVEMLRLPPIPRCWFLNRAGSELIQIQQDRFIHNWRKTDLCAEYPRYERIRRTFEAELRQFAEFVSREQLGEFAPTQCEVTYINHILAGETWQLHGELGRIIHLVAPRHDAEFLPQPEDMRVGLRYVIKSETGDPIGRLHVSADPAYRASDAQPIFVLNLTARGQPEGRGAEGVLAFLDLGREWVVRGFASLTTAEMHRAWRRQA